MCGERGENKITVVVNGAPREVSRGAKLKDCIRVELPCGGHGKCGKCKVRFASGASPVTTTEQTLLTPAELAQGVRLACEARLENDCEVELCFENIDGKACVLTDGVLPDFTLRPAFEKYAVAVDIGTTTLAVKLLDTQGETLGEASATNPQTDWGADVVARIEAALHGEADGLSKSVKRELDSLIFGVCRGAGVRSTEIDGAVITGNTAMLYLFVGVDITPLSRAPFQITERFGRVYRAETLGLLSLAKNTEVYFPPCVSAFVGADTVCAILATGLTDFSSPSLLVDIGTNGETAFWTGESLSACSTAAGPAFEGVGISVGMRAETGAVYRVELQESGLQASVIGGAKARGVCGSGLVDATACLLTVGAIEYTGLVESEGLKLQDEVCLTQKDIRMVQLAKSAVCAGIETLVTESGAVLEEVERVFVAGGLGANLNAENAERIGVFPNGFAGKIQTVGNAALGGAVGLALDTSLREKVETMVSARVVELAKSGVFSERFVENIHFSNFTENAE